MRQLIRRFLQRFGYDIVKLKAVYRHGALDPVLLLEENRWLMSCQFKTIVDIGANEGQFSEKIRILFPEASIYAFEPLQDVFEKLTANFKDDKKFFPVPLGVGDQPGKVDMFRNESTASSSLLEMTEAHTGSFVEAVDTTMEKIEITTLDQYFLDKELEDPLLVKMDVQGLEAAVIAGGEAFLKQADMILTEVSFEELYKNQPLFDEIYHKLTALGFSFAGCYEQLRRPADNRILQADAIFLKKEVKNNE